MNRLVIRKPAVILFTLASELYARLAAGKNKAAAQVWALLGDGRPLRSTLFQLAVLPIALVVIAVGLTIQQVVRDQVKTEDGEKLKHQAIYFTKTIDQAIDRHLVDIRSRAALLPKFNLDHDHRALENWMLTVQSEVTDYTWIGFADQDGVIRASTQSNNTLAFIGDTPWFQQGLKQPVAIDSPNIKPPFANNSDTATTQPRAIYLAAPVYGQQGKLSGVLIGYLDWRWIVNQHTEITRQLSTGNAGDMFVVSPAGDAHLVSQHRNSVSVKSLNSFQSARRNSAGWQHEIWPDNTSYLIGYARSTRAPDNRDIGWATFVRLPAIHHDSKINSLLAGLWFVIVIAIIGIALITGLLLRLTLRPLESMAKTMNNVANHGGSLAISRPAPTEFQTLTAAANRMVQAIREREATNQAKTKLLADISHEIRTPLHGLIGHAELLKTRLADPKDQADMYRLIGCAKEITVLVNDALDLSAIELQRMRLKIEPISLKELVDFNVGLFRSLAIQKGLFFDLDFQADQHLVVLADRLRFGQVLRNLFSNAVKFTAKGGVRVTIVAQPVARPISNQPPPQTITLTVEVSDSGVGISDDRRPDLFMRYQQAHNPGDATVTQHQVGSGLGLAISQGLINAMDGSIELQSALGHGTSVLVRLPLPIVPAESPSPMPPPPSISSVSPKPTLRILLVEDAPENREVMQRWFAQQGHQVAATGSGQDALRLVNERTFDLLVLDIDLPDMDGRTIAQTVRKSSHANARAKIFALSGRAHHRDHQASIDAGIDLHIDKPLDFERFSAQIDGVGRNTFGSS